MEERKIDPLLKIEKSRASQGLKQKGSQPDRRDKKMQWLKLPKRRTVLVVYDNLMNMPPPFIAFAIFIP